jgi:hypothetical protein
MKRTSGTPVGGTSTELLTDAVTAGAGVLALADTLPGSADVLVAALAAADWLAAVSVGRALALVGAPLTETIA